jgi:Ca-activated chloride channel family protein
VSDGHANAGVTDPHRLGQLAAQARTHAVTTSTLGFGLGYDKRLLGALAQGGAGNELFAEEADTAVAMISGEVEGLLAQVAQAASLRVTFTPHVQAMQVINDLPVVELPDGALLELGSFYAGETRKLLIKLHVPGIPSLGFAQVATLEFTLVSLPDLVQHTTTTPVHVNVVPGDEAAGRIPDSQVVSEALFQQTQKAKKETSRLLYEGDYSQGSTLLRTTSATLRAQSAGLPAPMAAELLGEADLMDSIAEESQVDVARASKVMSYDTSQKTRTRGRQTRGGRLVLRWAYGHDDITHSVLALEEWEVTRLVRVLSPTAKQALRPTMDALRDESTREGHRRRAERGSPLLRVLRGRLLPRWLHGEARVSAGPPILLLDVEGAALDVDAVLDQAC